MNKICGYNCEHNKGGICQITYCDKIGKMTTTTQEPQILTRWVDPTIKEKDKEIERLNNIINNIKKEYELFMQSDFNTNNCITFINKIEKELKEKSD